MLPKFCFLFTLKNIVNLDQHLHDSRIIE
uniref:Uncharacterized protein n=1 Tax=Rhizophora mucronata TaxID=61149 RepID=A0A2P2PZ14_RHIMU